MLARKTIFGKNLMKSAEEALDAAIAIVQRKIDAYWREGDVDPFLEDIKSELEDLRDDIRKNGKRKKSRRT